MKTLSEAQSKIILADYGVPVTAEVVADDVAQAVAAAIRLGFPVVLKGHGAKLAHKSELGLVFLDLGDEAAVRAACEGIVQRAGERLEGFLVQPMVKGRRGAVSSPVCNVP